MSNGKFSGYRTVAMAADHTDAMGYIDIQTWPTLDDCLIGAWDIASKSTWRKNQVVASLPVKWVIGQVFVAPNLGRDIPYWRTIEVIALNYDGSRILHSLSDKSGISFDFDTPDGDFGPRPITDYFNFDESLAIPLSQFDKEIYTANGDPVLDRDPITGEIYSAPAVRIDPATGQLESANQYLDRCSVAPEISPFSPLQQIPYYTPGVSHEIRNALIHRLGYIACVANLAVISWRKGDNGETGWTADMPNGASHVWADGAFVTPTPRAELTELQVTELLIQLEHFTAVSNDSSDLDRCINASVFALAIMQILG